VDGSHRKAGPNDDDDTCVGHINKFSLVFEVGHELEDLKTPHSENEGKMYSVMTLPANVGGKTCEPLDQRRREWESPQPVDVFRET